MTRFTPEAVSRSAMSFAVIGVRGARLPVLPGIGVVGQHRRDRLARWRDGGRPIITSSSITLIVDRACESDWIDVHRPDRARSR